MDVFNATRLNQAPRGLAYAMGNFDGVHLGHQAVLNDARKHGDLGVISFSPHPRRFFKPDLPRFELTTLADKNRLLAGHNVEAHAVLDFDDALAAMTPEAFIDYLAENLAPKHLSVGRNFRFGRGRTGTAETLQSLAGERCITVNIIDLASEAGLRYSSSSIREALTDGNPRRAWRILGRPHIVSGVVERGDQRGRDLGFPTANLVPTEVMLPKFGIYASRVTIHTGTHKGTYLGASSTGTRPSFGINAPNFETYLLDFDGDIYGADISVSLIEYLRPETKFDGIEALIAQMNADVARAREILKSET